MKKVYFLKFSFLAFVLMLHCSLSAQPAMAPATKWTVKIGNPAVFQPPLMKGILNKVAFSPDGATLAVCGGLWKKGEEKSNQGLIYLRNPQNGASQGELRGHSNVVQDISFSPDGKWLASESRDGELFIWEVATQRLKYRLSEARQAQNIKEKPAPPILKIGSWSPDSEILATRELSSDSTLKPLVHYDTIKLFRVADGQFTKSFSLPPGSRYQMKWDNSGKSLISLYLIINGNEVLESGFEVVDVEAERVERTTVVSPNKNTYINDYSADGRYALLTLYGQITLKEGIPPTRTFQVWDIQAGKSVWSRTEESDKASQGVFTNDGRSVIVSGDDNEIIFYDALTGVLQKTLPDGCCNDLSSIAISPDEKRLAFLEKSGSALYLWSLDVSLPTHFASKTLLHGVFSQRAFLWKDNRLISVEGVSNWKDGARNGVELRIMTWDSTTGKIQKQTIPEKRTTSLGALSPDGNLLAIKLGTEPRPADFLTEGVGLYDVREGKFLRLLPEKYDISSMAWSPDSKTLATNLFDSDIKIWDVASGKLQRKIKTQVQTIDWSPDGKIIVAGDKEGIVQFFVGRPDVKDDDLPLDQQIEGSIRFVAFSPDMKTLAVAVIEKPDTKNEKSLVHLLDLSTGQDKQVFPTQKALREIRWTPDGTGLAATNVLNADRTLDKQLRIWDANTGKELVDLDTYCGLDDFVFSPDGNQVAAHTWNSVRLWKLK